MKHSIKNIFRNLSLFLILAAVFAGLGVLVALDHAGSYKKIDTLTNQKLLASDILNLSKENLELSFIQLEGKKTQLRYDIEKLYSLYQYSFMERFILSNSKEYIADSNTLELLRADFIKKANTYFESKKDEELRATELAVSFDSYKNHVNDIIIKSISYDKVKFSLHKQATFVAFIIILIVSFWYRKRLTLIYNDLEFLNSVNFGNYEAFSQEIDAILLKVKRKVTVAENPTMVDAVTGINNLKGLMSSYAEKRETKDGAVTSVSVFEVDNFSASNKPYSQELTQSILKKIAFSISLHQQATDIIARTDYNQFTVIFSRPNKEQLLKSAQNIRQSIAELKISSPEFGKIEVTLSGGHVLKPKNLSLAEAIRQAKKILSHAQKNGKNRIFQAKDVAQNEL
ncbi:MAG: diguanylate cyclase [Sulfurimonas sp.]|nr:diguanylate cyclase [Sulfurimonas sp.]